MIASPSLQSFFSETGLLRKNLEHFERRPGQETMALAVAEALDAGKKLLVEAGTGTGKSFAYLAPLILWAVENQQRTCVSTHTKALQQQLMEKDLPLISRALGVDFKYALCFGANNYLCKRRLAKTGNVGLFTEAEEIEQMERLRLWEKSTATGLCLDLPFQPRPSVWEEVGRQKELCLGKNCPYQQSCFYQKARREWQRAHLLVVNHHLFFANLAGNGGVLPEVHAVVFDEAHHVEDVATAHFGMEATDTGLRHALERIYSSKGARGFLNRLSTTKKKFLKPLAQAVQEAEKMSERFFDELAGIFGNKAGVHRLIKPDFTENLLNAPLKAVCAELDKLKELLKEDDDALLEAEYYRAWLEEFNNSLAGVISQPFPDYVYWFESASTRRRRLSLKGCPVEVGELLKNALFAKEIPMVLTSATLAAGGKFDYIKGRLGLEKPAEAIFPSPFRFHEQALLYTVRDFPDPAGEPDRFLEASVSRIKELLEAGSGNAFVLFTSHSMLTKTHAELSASGLPWTLFKQGEMPMARIMELFKEKKGSVLLGTNTFWEGVDVPGDDLQSVIITRLPFAVPTEPLVEARIERLKEQGRNPFFELQVPRAGLMLKQGFGRLIRHMEDRGMVAILDPRVHTKNYGRTFLGSLPKCRETGEMVEVRKFFDELKKREGISRPNEGH